MRNKPCLIFALSIAGWAAVCMWNQWTSMRRKNRAARSEKKQMAYQIDTWEGEGGNLPSGASRRPTRSQQKMTGEP